MPRSHLDANLDGLETLLNKRRARGPQRSSVMKRFFHVTGNTLTAAGRGRYRVPNFAVYALDADSVVSTASKIVLCDRRTSDGVLWTFAGVVIDSETGDVVLTFSIAMKES